MAVKRKFSDEFDDVAPTVRSCTHIVSSRVSLAMQNGKQQKLIPFPNSTELDSDVAMSDASMSDLEPLAIPAHQFHTRLDSDASYASSLTSDSPRDSREYYDCRDALLLRDLNIMILFAQPSIQYSICIRATQTVT